MSPEERYVCWSVITSIFVADISTSGKRHWSASLGMKYPICIIADALRSPCRTDTSGQHKSFHPVSCILEPLSGVTKGRLQTLLPGTDPSAPSMWAVTGSPFSSNRVLPLLVEAQEGVPVIITILFPWVLWQPIWWLHRVSQKALGWDVSQDPVTHCLRQASGAKERSLVEYLLPHSDSVPPWGTQPGDNSKPHRGQGPGQMLEFKHVELSFQDFLTTAHGGDWKTRWFWLTFSLKYQSVSSVKGCCSPLGMDPLPEVPPEAGWEWGCVLHGTAPHWEQMFYI